MNLAYPFRWRRRVFALVLVVPPLVHLVPIHRVARWLGAPRDGYQDPPIDGLQYDVDRWLRFLPWPWRSTCLKRAAILFGLLRRSGVEVELHIGVKRDAEGAFAAHAWLVRNGQPYLESASSDLGAYSVITAFPEPSAS